MDEKTKIEKYLQKYEELNGANCYEIYFVIKHELYKIELKKLEMDIVKIAKESAKKGRLRKTKIVYSIKKKTRVAKI